MPYEPVDLGDPELNRIINLQRALDDDDAPVWWWLSFCDPHRPAGSQFLGVAIVEAPNLVVAALKAREHGCNPGGEIAAYPMPDDITIADEYRNRLLTREEADRASTIEDSPG